MSELEAIQDRWKLDEDISAGGMKGIEARKVLGKVRFRCDEHPDEHYEIDFSIGWRPMKDELSVDHCRVCSSSQSEWEGVHVSTSAPKCQDNSIDTRRQGLVRSYCIDCIKGALNVGSTEESKREEKK